MNRTAKILVVLNALIALALLLHRNGAVETGSASLAPSATATKSAAWVEQRVSDWMIKPSERQTERIAWAADVRDALRIARERNQLVLLVMSKGTVTSGRV